MPINHAPEKVEKRERRLAGKVKTYQHAEKGTKN